MDRMTDTCINITLPQTSFAGGKNIPTDIPKCMSVTVWDITNGSKRSQILPVHHHTWYHYVQYQESTHRETEAVTTHTTRMHSSRTRTTRSSSRLRGGVSTRTPRSRHPQDQTPPVNRIMQGC